MDKTIESYDKIASQYSNTHFAHFWVEEFDYFKELLSGKKIIDIGCGAGRDASVFVENGFDYLGIDASEGMLKIAKERVKDGKFQVMDFYHLNFLPETFDGFWAAASLLHIPKNHLKEVLSEIHKITKPSGIGFISVKEKKQLDEGLIDENKYGGIHRYFAFYTEDEFKKVLEESYFQIVKTSTHIENDGTKWLCFFVKK